MTQERPTIDRLRELLRYEPDTGDLVRLVTVGSRKAGSIAGSVDADGRRTIETDGRPLQAHVIAWAIETGGWPTGEIDHWDGNPANNRFKNLRDVSHGVNQQNRRRAAKHNKCGVLGVVLGATGRYSARIRFDGRQRHLGCFATAEEAHAAYLQAKRQHHEGCTL